ncbi:MAG: putative glycolipid-binding domain-containing protein [Thermoleophilia bacterium]|nr:putative glycolipid-binding domain-containing protein [Thermoleophilia bacterium]
MAPGPLPPFAAWRHVGAREGFEVVFLQEDGRRAEGHTTAIEDGEPFSVGYTIELDARHRARRARISARSRRGTATVRIDGDGEGGWRVNGRPVAGLDGCLDVDFESSALTNAFPVRRLGLAPGEQAEAPAVYVRALDLAVERLEQTYARRPPLRSGEGYDYACPAFDTRCTLVYDAAGLVLDYPGLAVRMAPP